MRFLQTTNTETEVKRVRAAYLLAKAAYKVVKKTQKVTTKAAGQREAAKAAKTAEERNALGAAAQRVFGDRVQVVSVGKSVRFMFVDNEGAILFGGTQLVGRNYKDAMSVISYQEQKMEREKETAEAEKEAEKEAAAKAAAKAVKVRLRSREREREREGVILFTYIHIRFP
jgi:hypothetical protein